MKDIMFERRVLIPASREEIFNYHEAEGCFLRITPPWEPVQLIEHTGGIKDGARVVIKVGPFPIQQTWVMTHQKYIQSKQFSDLQVSGPFKHWEHLHSFESAPNNS